MERRDFLKICAAGAATAGAPALAADARPQLYSRTLLVDEKGAALRASRVPVERNGWLRITEGRSGSEAVAR